MLNFIAASYFQWWIWGCIYSPELHGQALGSNVRIFLCKLMDRTVQAALIAEILRFINTLLLIKTPFVHGNIYVL